LIQPFTDPKIGIPPTSDAIAARRGAEARSLDPADATCGPHLGKIWPAIAKNPSITPTQP
jgi:hypothetical protein